MMEEIQPQQPGLQNKSINMKRVSSKLFNPIVLGYSGVILLAVLLTYALKAQTKQPPPKKYKVELSMQEWQQVMAAIEMSKAALKRSDLPSKEVVFINDSLFVPIQSVFVNQINVQLEAEKPKTEVKKDTTKPKKP